MSRRLTIFGLAAAALLQLGVLAVEYLGSVYPLWTGREIRLRTVPVDPRDMFRGNYARLKYEISTVRLPPANNGFRQGEIVYVLLKEEKDGLWTFAGATLEKPAGGLFLRGRIEEPRWLREGGKFQVRYGIEAFFAPKEKAEALERNLRHQAVAVIMVAANGKATLKDVVTQEQGR